MYTIYIFFFSSRRRHTRFDCDWSSDVCSSDLLLVVHGSADPLIPATLGRQLFDAASEPKRFVLIEGGNHHNTQSRAMEQYRQALDELFGLRLLAQAPTAPADRKSVV